MIVIRLRLPLHREINHYAEAAHETEFNPWGVCNTPSLLQVICQPINHSHTIMPKALTSKLAMAPGRAAGLKVKSRHGSYDLMHGKRNSI